MKYEYYQQMPGSLATGTDTLTVGPDPSGNMTRLKSVYIDLPAGVTLNISLSSLGSGQNDIISNGNEAGSIVFRSGVIINTPIIVTVNGTPNTTYGVKLITEVETPEANISLQNIGNFPATQYVNLTNPSIDIGNFPDSQDVNVTNFQDPQNVKVTNFPAAGVAQAGFSGAQLLLVAGLAVGFVYMAMKKKEKEIIVY